MPDEPRATDSSARPPSTGGRNVNEFLDEQELDETLDDTFPASDPPSWTFGVDETRREEPQSPSTDEKPSAGRE